MIPIRNLKRFAGKALQQPGYAARVFGKRARAAFSRRFSGGRSVLPEAITLFLTHRCNLRCRMCGQWGDHGVTKTDSDEHIGRQLSREQVLQCIGEISSFRPNITLFGGEPLLYPHCLQIIRSVKDLGMHCLVITNGSLLAEKAEELVESGLDELNVSLDGGQRLHDAIRGMPGLWARIMHGLQKVSACKNRLKRTRPLVNIQCTISSFNYRELERMPAVCLEAGADSLTFHHLIFIEQQAVTRQREFDEFLHSSSRQWEGFVFDAGIDTRILYEQMHRVRANPVKGLRVDFYPPFSKRELKAYYSSAAGAKRRACASPWVVAYIFPDGQVRPCLNFDYSFGSIQDELFSDIWNSPKAVSYRQLLKMQGAFPVCRRCTELYRY